MIDYQVIRSARRKTLSIQVKLGEVVVRAPYCVDKKIINDLVQQKSAWLKSTITAQLIRKQQCCQFRHNDKLFFFGQQVRLHISFAKKPDTYVNQAIDQMSQLNVVLPERQQIKLNNDMQRRSAVKKQLEGYFKTQAQTLILSRLEYFSRQTQLNATSTKIRQYSARWGSCNSRGELSFNYLMVMLPDNVIDYIIVHELCHLVFLDHSANFWRLVAKHFPSYLQAKQWLKENQSQLLWRLS